MTTQHPYRFGIEEEYFLADASTGGSPDGRSADRFHEEAKRFVGSVGHEFLKGQVEVQTEPLADLDEAREALRSMRRSLSACASEHGLALFAAGTHPLALTRDQEATPDERYRPLERELGIIARRAMICAMHIHVEPPDPEARLSLMNRMIPFLPLIYALSVSSPFWQGRESQLRGIRLSAFAEWPRMGVPEIFSDARDYDRFVELMVSAGVVKDASYIWWHIRPSHHFPTVELRVCDSCTRLDDAIAIAALYRSLARLLSRRPEVNAGVGPLDRGVCASNIWQVQQHGRDARLIDVERGGATGVAELLEQAIGLAEEDAEALGVSRWLGETREILRRGSSADRQIAAFRDATDNGATRTDALRAVVAMLARETAA